MEKIYPPLPQKGDKVALFAPSYWVDETTIEIAQNALINLGFEVVLPEQLQMKHGQVGGTVAQRVEAFHSLFQDPSIKGVFAVRGGYGALQLLDSLDYDLIKTHPTFFMASSDSTVLLNSIYARSGLVGHHGVMFGAPPHAQKLFPQTVAALQSILDGATEVNFGDNAVAGQTGQATGTLLGGNARVFDQLIGTPYFPQDENIILLLEDVCEKISEIDKNMLHLKHAGLLGCIKGVIIAELDLFEDNTQPFGFSATEILQHYLPKDVPIVVNVPCGHGEVQFTTPVGVQVTLEVAAATSRIFW